MKEFFKEIIIKSCDNQNLSKLYSANQLIDYLDKRKTYFSYGENYYNYAYIKELEKYEDIIIFSIIQHYDFSERLSKLFIEKTLTLWNANKKKDYINLTFLLMVTNLYQTLFNSKKLLFSGFENQSKILFRSYIELSNLLILILLDENFSQEYCEFITSNEEKKQKWFRSLRPSVINKKIHEILVDKKETIPYDENLLSVRDYIYENYSKQVHFNDFEYNLHQTYSKKFEGYKVSTTNNVSRFYRTTLKELIEFSANTYILILIGMKNHGYNYKDDELLKFRDLVFYESYIKCLFNGLYDWTIEYINN